MNERRQELYAELRENAPVFSTPDFFLVTRYQDVKDIIEKGDRFKARTYPTSGTFVLGKDKKPEYAHAEKHEHEHDEDHNFLSSLLPDKDLEKIRKIASDAARKFVDAALSADEEVSYVIQKDSILRDTIKTKIDDTKKNARGRIDLLAEFARLVPIEVVKAYFGVPEPDPEDFDVLPFPRLPDPAMTEYRKAARPFVDPSFPCLFNWTSANSRAFRYVTYDQFFSPNPAFAKTVSDQALRVRKDFGKHLETLLTQHLETSRSGSTKLGDNTLLKRLADGIRTAVLQNKQSVMQWV